MSTINKEMYRQLANNLSAAYIAYRLGVGVGYMAKKQKDSEPGDYWYHLAAIVDRELVNRMDEQLRPDDAPTEIM